MERMLLTKMDEKLKAVRDLERKGRSEPNTLSK